MGEVEKAMLKGRACHFQLIFDLFTIPKCELLEVEKPMLQRHA